ncbi:hypothetical protein ACFZAV_06615 [Streptomyces sp. NPDC008343]|uniref:hypothetical protein n=1 Tax=Streptomyces sp. NPDC008343 TaxID=3364828 RepID=UPI0036EEE874
MPSLVLASLAIDVLTPSYAAGRGPALNDQEAQDFGISTDRVGLEAEHVFYDADDGVLRHTVTVDYSSHPYTTRYQTTPDRSTPRSVRRRRGRSCS